MDYYLDIQVVPDLEITAPVLLNNLFAKFHRIMAKKFNSKIAVSFPQYGRMLGEVLRLHGNREILEQLMADPWLKGLRDYTHLGDIAQLPNEIIGYRTVYRVQKKSPQNLRKRIIAKGWLTEKEALLQIPDSKQALLRLPFLQLQSLSNKNIMRIYIQQGDILPTATHGNFSSYGLSRTATIPWF